MRIVVAAVLAVLASQGAAEAQAVEVGRIAGPRGSWVQRELSGALGEAGVSVGDGAAVVVTGRLRRAGRRYVLRLSVARGGSSEDLRIVERQPQQLISAAVAALRPHLDVSGGGAPAPPAAAVPDSRGSPASAHRSSSGGRASGGRASGGGASGGDPPSPAPSSAGGGALSGEDALELAIGVDWMARVLSFNDDLFDRIGQYELLAAPVARVSLRWFPAHHWTADPLAGFGITAEAFGAFGLESTTQDGMTSFATTADAWSLGLVYRVRVADPLRLEGSVDYGEQRFRIDPAGPLGPGSGTDPIPSVRYSQLRPALAVHVDIAEGFSIRAAGGWRAVLSAGEFGEAEWFPRSFTTGVDMSLAVYWRFDRWFAIRVHAQHTRYITDIRPEPGDVRVAGGALDEWTRAGGDFIVILPGAR